VSARILIAGIGNIFFGDDAFGSEVARRLMREQWPENVQVVDFGIRGFDLTFALLDGYDTVILLDATPRGGSAGTLYTIEPDRSAIESRPPEVEPHGMDPLRVLAMAHSMGARWQRLILVGCEPSGDPWNAEGIGLSEPVRGAIEEAVKVVRRLAA
jgi:hydrogenase maturation protease